jgi:hypothetical protein
MLPPSSTSKKTLFTDSLHTEDHSRNLLRKFYILVTVLLSIILINNQLDARPVCRRSPTQSDIYQVLYWYNWLSWWWAQGCWKHVENRYRYIYIKEIVITPPKRRTWRHIPQDKILFSLQHTLPAYSSYVFKMPVQDSFIQCGFPATAKL